MAAGALATARRKINDAKLCHLEGDSSSVSLSSKNSLVALLNDYFANQPAFFFGLAHDAAIQFEFCSCWMEERIGREDFTSPR